MWCGGWGSSSCPLEGLSHLSSPLTQHGKRSFAQTDTLVPTNHLPTRKAKPGRVSSMCPGKEHVGKSVVKEVRQMGHACFDVLCPGGLKSKKEDQQN